MGTNILYKQFVLIDVVFNVVILVNDIILINVYHLSPTIFVSTKILYKLLVHQIFFQIYKPTPHFSNFIV